MTARGDRQRLAAERGRAEAGRWTLAVGHCQGCSGLWTQPIARRDAPLNAVGFPWAVRELCATHLRRLGLLLGTDRVAHYSEVQP